MFWPRSATVSPAGVLKTLIGFRSSIRRTGGPGGQGQRRAGDVPASDPAREVAAIPAVAEEDAHRVVTRAQQRGHVVGLVLQALAVARPSGREELVADAPAVEAHLVKAVAR